MIDPEFQTELEHLLNRHGVDSQLNIPDFVLAEILAGHLSVLETALNRLDKLRNPNGKDKDTRV